MKLSKLFIAGLLCLVATVVAAQDTKVTGLIEMRPTLGPVDLECRAECVYNIIQQKWNDQSCQYLHDLDPTGVTLITGFTWDSKGIWNGNLLDRLATEWAAKQAMGYKTAIFPLPPWANICNDEMACGLGMGSYTAQWTNVVVGTCEYTAGVSCSCNYKSKLSGVGGTATTTCGQR